MAKPLRVDSKFKALLMALPQQDYAELEKSILEVGCEIPLAVWNDTVIDGHNRYAICQKHGINFQILEKDFDDRTDAKIWIVKNQFHRRNLNKYQRAKLALELKPLIAEKAKAQQGTRTDLSTTLSKSVPVDTRKDIAKSANISEGTIAKVEKIEAKATDEQKTKLETGDASINQVDKEIRSKERREGKTQMILELAEEPAPELDSIGRFPVLYVDPPWRYEHSISDSRKIENQYPTMALDDIKDLDIESIATDPAILFMWATSPKLSEAMEVIEAWEFTYRTSMVWVKDRIGMGYYARQRHELLLIATKGSMLTPEPTNRPDSVIESPREKHSKKPEVVYELIERMYPELPKLELFARNTRKGWMAWGDESK